MTRKNEKYANSVKSYGTRGTHVRSAEGSAIGLSRADAEDVKSLARAGARRANQLGRAKA
jgi:hypothetical protein